MTADAKQRTRVCSARMLLECIQAGEYSGDEELRTDARSMRSWLVFKMRFRTIEIPELLADSYDRLLKHFSEVEQ